MINKKYSEAGESLLEVVISAVILGLIGVLLVSSVATARPFADKMSLMGRSVAELNMVAESINAQTFARCNPNTSQPYSVSLPPAATGNVVTGPEITNDQLPPVIVGGSNYSAKLNLSVVANNISWTVEPPLPAGLNLDSNSGVISGQASSPITSEYLFTANFGKTKASKLLLLSALSIAVNSNDGTSWVPCNQIQISAISSSSGNGKSVTYSYNTNKVSLTSGNLVTVWNSSNQSFDGNSLLVTNFSDNSATVQSNAIGANSGGYIAKSTQVDVQQVVVSTIVSGTPLQKVITKVAN
jgi:hypothetical protein